jgi:two-component system, chemotaxis family, chemotaxis protein CheY
MAILVVDDSKAMRMIVLRELRKAGYDTGQAVEADNGLTALDKIRAGGVELVLSDWNMPDMSGIELLAELRREGIAVPFGFVTSESAGEIRRRALEVGADFVVTKPFTGDDLSRQVDLALGGGGEGSGEGAGAAGKEQTVADVLTELLGRDVVTVDAAPPDKSTSRAVARYVTAPGGRAVFCVAEMSAAAAMGAALSRIPGSQAGEWAQAHALPEAIHQNLYEVANVLAKIVVPPDSGERGVLQDVSIIPDLIELPGQTAVSPDAWRTSFELRIEGYPPGRVGFISF